jgi:hypothetical protein
VGGRIYHRGVETDGDPGIPAVNRFVDFTTLTVDMWTPLNLTKYHLRESEAGPPNRNTESPVK